MLHLCGNKNTSTLCIVWVVLHMCLHVAEWESGHSRVLGFLANHHPQAFIHLIVKALLKRSGREVSHSL